MGRDIKIISFDVEGTLVTTDFSYAIWFEMIPQRYAIRHGLELEAAKREIKRAYDSVGDQRPEWYNVQYWFNRFALGEADIAMESFQDRVKYFPETREVLDRLGRDYRLNVASGSPRHFLKYLLRDVEHNFSSIFSSISDFQKVKTADFYRVMCRRLGVEPHQVVHVGDNLQFDVNEPASIGIYSFHLDREGTTGSSASLRSLEQLAGLLENL